MDKHHISSVISWQLFKRILIRADAAERYGGECPAAVDYHNQKPYNIGNNHTPIRFILIRYYLANGCNSTEFYSSFRK